MTNTNFHVAVYYWFWPLFTSVNSCNGETFLRRCQSWRWSHSVLWKCETWSGEVWQHYLDLRSFNKFSTAVWKWADSRRSRSQIRQTECSRELFSGSEEGHSGGQWSLHLQKVSIRRTSRSRHSCWSVCCHQWVINNDIMFSAQTFSLEQYTETLNESWSQWCS